MVFVMEEMQWNIRIYAEMLNEIHNLTNGVNPERIILVILGLVKVPCLEQAKGFTINATNLIII